jgi:hypothetical protein
MYYLAYSKDTKIREEATAGGVVKSILCDLLSRNKVDYVLITRMNGRIAETIITANIEDIISPATNSIYQPTNPLSLLSSLDSTKKYAAVLLPCHIHTLRRLQGYGIGNEIVFTISLFCNHTPNIEWTEANFKDNSVQYRGGKGLKNYTKHFPVSGYMPETCKKCYVDRSGIDADISAGDAWAFGNNDLQEGKTYIRINTEIGKQYQRESENIIWEEVEDRIDKYRLAPRSNPSVIPINYWKMQELCINYGDYIAELIVKEFGYRPEYCDRAKHDYYLFSVGSHPYRQAKEHPDYPSKMKLWGCGCDHDRIDKSFLRNSEVYALRGDMSCIMYGYDVPKGDPGYLLPILFPIKRTPEDYTLFIPHWSQRHIIPPDNAQFVDIFVAKGEAWWKFLRRIVNARMVYTSSLHVAITCEAYGVPYEVYGQISYKWLDIDRRYDPHSLISTFPETILNWRTLNI